jgi:hypothetical protein
MTAYSHVWGEHLTTVLATPGRIPGILNPSSQLPPTSHGVEHHLPTNGRPITAKFCALDTATHVDFEDLEQQGIVRRSRKLFGLSSACGEKIPWYLAAMWRFLAAEPNHAGVKKDCNHHTILPARVDTDVFRLGNSSQTFQHMMDHFILGLDRASCYLDDILVAFPDERSHQRHLQPLLEQLRKFGLVLDLEKDTFGQS